MVLVMVLVMAARGARWASRLPRMVVPMRVMPRRGMPVGVMSWRRMPMGVMSWRGVPVAVMPRVVVPMAVMPRWARARWRGATRKAGWGSRRTGPWRNRLHWSAAGVGTC